MLVGMNTKSGLELLHVHGDSIQLVSQIPQYWAAPILVVAFSIVWPELYGRKLLTDGSGPYMADLSYIHRNEFQPHSHQVVQRFHCVGSSPKRWSN